MNTALKTLNLAVLASALIASTVFAAPAKIAQPAKKPASTEATPAAPIVDAGASLKAGSSTVSAESEISAAAPTPWSPSVQLYNYRGVQESDDLIGNRLYLNLGYKISPTLSIQASQRFLYDMKKAGNEQAQQKTVKDMDLRINVVQSGLKALNSDTTILYRVALPTTGTSRIENKHFAYFLVNPSLAWKVDAKSELSWDVSYQTITYRSAEGSAFASAFARQNHALAQAGTYSYSLAEKVGVYGSVGHSASLRNSSQGAAPQPGLSVHGHWADIETGVNWAPLKNLSFKGYLSQSHALVASDGAGIIASNGTDFRGFSLFRPEQTSVEVFTTLTF